LQVLGHTGIIYVEGDKMIASIKVRLEPNNKQNSKMFQSAGTARWAYNWALNRQQENYKQGNKFLQDGVLRKELTQLKKTNEFSWLKHYSNNITKQAIKDCCNAYKNFFKGLAEPPKFKSRKKSKPSFYQDTAKIKFTSMHVRLEKIGWIRLSERNRIPVDTKYMNPRVNFDGVHWFISVGIEIENIKSELTNESIGIDLGIKDLAICSNKMTFKNINKTSKVKKLEKEIRRLQRMVSNKYQLNKKGGSYVKTSNIIKLEKKIKKVYKNLDNIRTNYIHQVTTKIVKTKPSRVVMEDLNISGMMKNRHLSKAIAQQNFYKFIQTMKYKCEKYGIEFISADRFYPSSKTCSKCGAIKKDLKLSDRTYVCSECGCVIDRDYNASINLSRYELV